jgi:hypothetical protein
MANSNANVITRDLHGKFGDQVVFRTSDGESITANVPDTYNATPSEAQLAVRERFKEATLWAKNTLADPDMLAAYSAKATGRMTAYTLAVADYLRAPKVTRIDVTGYSGHAGDIIFIKAIDDFKVKEVKVGIVGPDGNVLEKGNCVADANGIFWLYTATAENDPPQGTVITATAKDNPGNTGSMSVTIA